MNNKQMTPLDLLVDIVRTFDLIRRASAHYIMSYQGAIDKPGEAGFDFQHLVDQAVSKGLIKNIKTGRGSYLKAI